MDSISPWFQSGKKKPKNEDSAAQGHKTLLKKIRPSTKHKDLFIKLHQKFTTARLKWTETILPNYQKAWLLDSLRSTTLNYVGYKERKQQTTSYLTYRSK